MALEENQNNEMKSDRRGFLKFGATAGASLIVTPGFSNSSKRHVENDSHHGTSPDKITKQRTLGSGKFSLTVSSLGLGCMGMSYHRGRIPDRKVSIALIRKAVELGVTLFEYRGSLRSINQ